MNNAKYTYYLIIFGFMPDKSIIDDGLFEFKSPTSITKSISQPSYCNISEGLDNTSSSDIFALVVVIGNKLDNLQAS